MARLLVNFHDLLQLEIESSDPAVLAYFRAEYGGAPGRVEPGLPLVRLRWGAPGAEGADRARLRSTSHKLIARWRYRLDWQPDGLQIKAMGNRPAIPMVHHMLVHHGLRYIGSQHGLLLLHAAALVRGQRSLLLTGRGGAGKTTTSSLVLAYGDEDWRLHADDYVFIAPDSQTYSYLTRAHLYLPLLRWIPELAARLSPAERLQLELLGRVRRMSGDRLKWPVRVSTEHLWPHRMNAARAKLGAVVFLEKGSENGDLLEEIEPSENLIADMMEMNFREAGHFRRLVEAAPGGPPASAWWEVWKKRERRLLEPVLPEVRCYRLRLAAQPQGSQVDRTVLPAAIQSLMEDPGL